MRFHPVTSLAFPIVLALSAAGCTGGDESGGSSGSGAGAGGGGTPPSTFFLPTGEPGNTSGPSVELDAAGGMHMVSRRSRSRSRRTARRVSSSSRRTRT